MVYNGVLNVDKPVGPTSHDVVAAVRRLTKGKVGHTGTLDPAASGILLLALGSATRLITFTHVWPKTYDAEIILGATSTTDDAVGIVSKTSEVVIPTSQEIATVLKQFTGTITQIPPIYSALKSGGKNLYEYARAGKSEEAQKRAGEKVRLVTIYKITLIDYVYPILKLSISCSSGTYIRSLARDIGAALNSGAYLSALRRIKIGPFDISKSIQFDAITLETIAAHLQPSAAFVADVPSVTLSADNVAQLRQGRRVAWSKHAPPDTALALYDAVHTLIGIGTFAAAEQKLSPTIILA